MASKVPTSSPLWFGDLACTSCGQTMKKELDKLPSGTASGVFYRCVNEKSGCSYEVYSDYRPMVRGQKVYNPPVEKAEEPKKKA